MRKIVFAIFCILVFVFSYCEEKNSPKGSFQPKAGIEISDIPEDEPLTSSKETPYRTEKIKIKCGRDKVNTELFYPAGGSNWPIVILLHGSHPKRTDAYYDVMAIDLAMHGYYCVFPHYFERNKRGRGTRTEWMKTIKSAIDFAQEQPNVNRERIAVIGYSLGSFLILGYAPTDKRINCVVAFYGGLSSCYKEIANEHMPPTLLLHGTKDRIVPARRSLEAFKTLREYGKPVSVVIYPNVGHGFTLHKKGEWDDEVSLDSWERTLSFLNYYLNFPSWIPEVGQEASRLALIAENQEESKDFFPSMKLETPYLDTIFVCGDKIYVDPHGEEYTKVLKESTPPPRKRKVVRRKK